MVVWGIDLLEYLRIDDPIGAVPVHMIAGIWGTLSLGLFAAGKYGASTAMGGDPSSPVTGLFYGGGFGVLKAQAIGSFSMTIATFVSSMALMYAVKYAFRLRIPTEGEIEGLDLARARLPRIPGIRCERRRRLPEVDRRCTNRQAHPGAAFESQEGGVGARATWNRSTETLRESSMRITKRAGLSRNSATDSGPARAYDDRTRS